MRERSTFCCEVWPRPQSRGAYYAVVGVVLADDLQACYLVLWLLLGVLCFAFTRAFVLQAIVFFNSGWSHQSHHSRNGSRENSGFFFLVSMKVSFELATYIQGWQTRARRNGLFGYPVPL